MASRRGYIRDIGMLGAGAGASYLIFNTDTVSEFAEDVSKESGGSAEQSKNRSVIQKTTFEGSVESTFQSVTFYSDGSASVLLAEDHPQGKIAFTHSNHSVDEIVYQRWNAPEFAGPIDIDMEEVVQANAPYPDDEFKFELVPDGDGFFIGDTEVTFQVPDSFMP